MNALRNSRRSWEPHPALLEGEKLRLRAGRRGEEEEEVWGGVNFLCRSEEEAEEASVVWRLENGQTVSGLDAGATPESVGALGRENATAPP